jgi:hypothetical protein
VSSRTFGSSPWNHPRSSISRVQMATPKGVLTTIRTSMKIPTSLNLLVSVQLTFRKLARYWLICSSNVPFCRCCLVLSILSVVFVPFCRFGPFLSLLSSFVPFVVHCFCPFLSILSLMSSFVRCFCPFLSISSILSRLSSFVQFCP